ncbi:MAG: phosphate ABC transporter substrate-binding/OmpA family protein [Rhodobacteraceae bacterium]|jgi:phosphate transport system substrate-binding protein|nr:phosphate ABC transporter substrate-binding/OmpA family protein [Paracoccaceae bacterium]
MGPTAWCAATLVVLASAFGAMAQDVTLTAREGGLQLDGTLQGFDGEFYRVNTRYGALTVDAQGVICTGPGCPELTAPFATLRFVGAPDAGAALVPPLIAAFAAQRGLDHTVLPGDVFAARLTDPVSGAALAEISFEPMLPDDATAALTQGAAEFAVAADLDPDLGNRAIAMDALIPVMAADNPTAVISSRDLAAVLAGDITNWAALGGPDMPIVLHALDPGTDLQRALEARLGRAIPAELRHPDLTSLANAVAADPYALAIIGAAQRGPARRLPLTDSCGFPLLPSAMAVKAEDYPLALPIHLLTPRRRLPLMAREFLEFLSSPPAQKVIASAGYIDRSPESQPMTADGLRLINAIRGAGSDVALADLQALVGVMTGADRVSLTFRFQDGSSALDASSQQNLADLAQLLGAGQFADKDLIFAGFSDGSGDAAANLALAAERAEGVAGALREAAPDLPADRIPRVIAFGEVLPIACDSTSVGRGLNRRVEFWLRPRDARPAGATDTLPP